MSAAEFVKLVERVVKMVMPLLVIAHIISRRD